MNDWWNDPSVPAQQLAVVIKELAEIRDGGVLPVPYRQFFACLDLIPKLGSGFESHWNGRGLLDIGAGMGHYGEALRLHGRMIWNGYVAVDASKSFKDAASIVFPWMKYYVGSAANLPFKQSSFYVVLSSACLMYAEDPMCDIWEATRVSSGYVIFHRTPIDKETRKVEAEAYGGTVLETRFSEADLFGMFDKAGLSLVHTETIFEMPDGYGHKTYLLKKEPVFPVRV